MPTSPPGRDSSVEGTHSRLPKPLFVWRRALINSTLAATTRHVLLTLSLHMNELGRSCYPSVMTLARETGLSRQSVMTHLGRAADTGWITIIRHGYPGRIWKRNEYTAVLPHAVNLGY